MSLINNKYTIIEKIGSGSFGSIYKGKNIRTHELVAIKVESIKTEYKLLKNESTIYQYLLHNIGIPSVKWFGKDEINYYMVIDLLGESLQNVKDEKTTFSLKLTLQIGIQIIALLNVIHQKGLVHRDIKPENFLLGTNNKNKQIYIIDFGFCKSFIVNEKHMSMRNTSSLIGSVTYASLNAHDNIELSRRDDMESLCYMLIYFYIGKLDWQDLDSIPLNKEKTKIVKQMKANIVENKSVPEILIHFLKQVRSLEFEENPNYIILTDMFKREIDLL